ncbi:MAG TPA: acetyl-CoA carboxylase biotin carboxyl carrier protein [Planctomycetaceae bacterium]
MSVDLKELRALFKLMAEAGVAELEIDQGDQKIRVKRAPGAASGAAEPVYLPAPQAGSGQLPAPPAAPGQAAIGAQAAGGGQPAPAAAATDGKGYRTVTSPIVGTFYRAPAPDAPPYVEVGSSVKKGQVLCIVEAMKLMNEIEAEFDGKVVAILVENGQAVEFGEALFHIEPL